MAACWKCGSRSECIYNVRLNQGFKFWWCINCLINSKTQCDGRAEVAVLRIARTCVSASHHQCGWKAGPRDEFPYGMFEKRLCHQSRPTPTSKGE